MADPDWSTEEGLAALKQELAGRIPGWRSPIAHAVGMFIADLRDPIGSDADRCLRQLLAREA